jgi:hypothetical protein
MGPPSQVLLCLKTETQLDSEMLQFFKKLNNGQCPLPNKKTVSVNFPYAVLSLLDFVTPEAGTCSKMLAWNYHSTLCSVSEENRSHTILRCRPRFGSA